MPKYPKFNKKSMEAPYDENRTEDKKTPTYPWVSGYLDDNGGGSSSYTNPDKPNESFVEQWHHNAGFDVNEVSENNNGLRNVLQHDVRDYSSGGRSTNSDGHTDVSNLQKNASHRENFKGDRGQSAGGNIFSGAGESTIDGTKSGGFTNHNGDTYATSTGNRISEHTGNTASHIEGDNTSSTKGNKSTIVNGENHINVQGGNMDIQVDSGQFRLKSGAKLTVTSDAEIVLVVGGSTVTINGSGITLDTSGKITLNAGGGTEVTGSSFKTSTGNSTIEGAQDSPTSAHFS